MIWFPSRSHLQLSDFCYIRIQTNSSIGAYYVHLLRYLLKKFLKHACSVNLQIAKFFFLSPSLRQIHSSPGFFLGYLFSFHLWYPQLGVWDDLCYCLASYLHRCSISLFLNLVVKLFEHIYQLLQGGRFLYCCIDAGIRTCNYQLRNVAKTSILFID